MNNAEGPSRTSTAQGMCKAYIAAFHSCADKERKRHEPRSGEERTVKGRSLGTKKVIPQGMSNHQMQEMHAKSGTSVVFEDLEQWCGRRTGHAQLSPPCGINPTLPMTPSATISATFRPSLFW